MKESAEQIKTATIKWLIKGGLSFNKLHDAIGVEVLFSTNRRRADLLIISKTLHSIEIKSDKDKIQKLSYQIHDYLKTFDKLSIISTLKHYRKIKKSVPRTIGIILFENNSFTVKRPAQHRKQLDKISLLMFLQKKELIKHFSPLKYKRLSTQEIRLKISKKFTVRVIRQAAFVELKQKYAKLFKLFLGDTSGNFMWDELRGLCGRVNRLS